MKSYPILAAAQMVDASYHLHPRYRKPLTSSEKGLAAKIKHRLDDDDVQAYFLTNKVLLIPGSDGVMDYLKFNLRTLNIGGKRYKVKSSATAKGDSGTIWHQGFLRHAKHIFDWLAEKGETPDYIMGHSLGAAATQILCKSYKVAGIGFASPRPRKHSGKLAGDEHCLCLNRNDDRVCKLPGGFNHVGTVRGFSAKGTFGMDHSMPHYLKVVRARLKDKSLSETWGGR